VRNVVFSMSVTFWFDGTRKLCEIFCAMQFLQKFINHLYRKFVLDGLWIQCYVIHTKPPCVICFNDEEDWRWIRRLTRSDDATLQHISALPFNFVFLSMGIAVRSHHYGMRSWLQRNAMVMKSD
jgi:hypothetical protein